MRVAFEQMQKTTLTGIKPTGTPHIGNYLGMIRPALDLARQYQALYFIADYHALNSLKDSQILREYTYQVAATWLALGLNPDEVIFYRQSDVPEIIEFAWILTNYTAKGLLNRAHAYKATSETNILEGRNPDNGINAGLFNYPVLMAADILLFDTEFVPVGADQKQHIEITRDIALSFNHYHGDILTIPQAIIREDVKTVPGLDGRKMSKSYSNAIEIFAPTKQLRKQVMRIVTDSKTPDEPKNPDECNIFNIYKHFATDADIAQVREQYLAGGLAYGAMKQTLFELLDDAFRDARNEYYRLLENPAEIDAILAQGAEKARHIAREKLDVIRKCVLG